ncbi:MAG: hypothetical protein RL308_3393 [Bacteroidota bacterium]|jgi:hypothetical protein
MKKPKMFDFKFINPFKRGFYVSFILKLSNYEYSEDYYLFTGFIFFQLEINFKIIYLTIIKLCKDSQ